MPVQPKTILPAGKVCQWPKTSLKCSFGQRSPPSSLTGASHRHPQEVTSPASSFDLAGATMLVVASIPASAAKEREVAELGEQLQIAILQRLQDTGKGGGAP